MAIQTLLSVCYKVTAYMKHCVITLKGLAASFPQLEKGNANCDPMKAQSKFFILMSPTPTHSTELYQHLQGLI